ncbi:hypothetical protein BDN70DRAFT_887329 [Pholiota conissans]|uniref:Uncharacterized protein n=1 Tax=Pholiota conissans TaxID=109636 RepID=A0A9P5YNF0_9AGAR|nr:hypothetical protein BDN70DRAFT_887329 [Pholiota conissans]
MPLSTPDPRFAFLMLVGQQSVHLRVRIRRRKRRRRRARARGLRGIAAPAATGPKKRA